MVLQINSSEAWKILQENSNAILIDVRTKEEVDFVGFADLSSIDKKAIFLPWKIYPQMLMDEDFTNKLSDILLQKFLQLSNENITLLFLCRSGNRSLEAAMFMSDLGYVCYNIKDGFEGSVDKFGHRSFISGWKSQNLPWRQN